MHARSSPTKRRGDKTGAGGHVTKTIFALPSHACVLCLISI